MRQMDGVASAGVEGIGVVECEVKGMMGWEGVSKGGCGVA